MQKSLYQTADAGDILMRQRMQEELYQTADAEVSLSDSGCRRHSIRQRMQKSLYQTADAGDTLSAADAGDSSIRQSDAEILCIRQSDARDSIRCLIETADAEVSIRQWMQETLYQTADAGDTL